MEISVAAWAHGGLGGVLRELERAPVGVELPLGVGCGSPKVRSRVCPRLRAGEAHAPQMAGEG